MATDDERREVAENLRTMCAYGVRYKEQFYDLLEETVMNVEDFHEFSDVAERLADLIEPDTTSDTAKTAADTTKCDRDALLALADEFESGARDARAHKWNEPANAAMAIALADEYEANARRIREACGEVDG